MGWDAPARNKQSRNSVALTLRGKCLWIQGWRQTPNSKAFCQELAASAEEAFPRQQQMVMGQRLFWKLLSNLDAKSVSECITPTQKQRPRNPILLAEVGGPGNGLPGFGNGKRSKGVLFAVIRYEHADMTVFEVWTFEPHRIIAISIHFPGPATHALNLCHQNVAKRWCDRRGVKALRKWRLYSRRPVGLWWMSFSGDGKRMALRRHKKCDFSTNWAIYAPNQKTEAKSANDFIGEWRNQKLNPTLD